MCALIRGANPSSLGTLSHLNRELRQFRIFKMCLGLRIYLYRVCFRNVPHWEFLHAVTLSLTLSVVVHTVPGADYSNVTEVRRTR